MNQRLTFLGGAALAVLVSGAALAQDNHDYQCTMGPLSRRVEVAYTTAAAVPCEVRYYKEAAGQDAAQVLWSAQNKAGYCEQKAKDFVAKLQGLGWMCSDSTSTGGSAPSGTAGAAGTGADKD